MNISNIQRIFSVCVIITVEVKLFMNGNAVLKYSRVKL